MVRPDNDSRRATSINQLKYVSRKLHRETAGLEILFNSIVFDSLNASVAIERFFEFAKHCTLRKIAWLKNVVLEDKAASRETGALEWVRHRVGSIVDLMRYCASNPHTAVALRVPRFEIVTERGTEAPYAFLGVGIVMTMILRGENISYIAPDYGVKETREAYIELINGMLGKPGQTIEQLRHNAQNLKFLPRALDWNRAHFCRVVLDVWNSSYPSPSALPADGGPDVWVKYAEQWMERGI